MTPPSRAQDINLLAERFVQAQEIDGTEARRIAMELSKDPEIMQAAIVWVRTGAYPSHPELEGVTPKQLSEIKAPRRMKPTQIFTAMLLLRIDPARGLDLLRYPLPKGIEEIARKARKQIEKGHALD